jgi:hypothetical protein
MMKVPHTMLTKADDFPIHQTPEPIAYAGTDRNFYDRYFFNGYSPDGSSFFAIAFGVYPHLNVADAHVSISRNGVQHCIHASKILNMERFDLEIGPIRIEILEPLRKLKVTLRETEGLAAEVTFEGRSFPIKEPRFTQRNGPRTVMDYTRMTQNGRYTGWLQVDGQRTTLEPGALGTRDRSWGVRPIGAPDTQPVVPAVTPGILWYWTPLNFPNRSVYFHVQADMKGDALNTRAVIVPDGLANVGIAEVADAKIDVVFKSGTRHAQSAVLILKEAAKPPVQIRFEPVARFQMRGIGYQHPQWGHGGYKGELVVEREDIMLAEVDVTKFENMHIQAFSHVRLTQAGAADEIGIGVFEQMMLGPYAPYNFKGMFDPAP